jgi:hypothetical protein
MPDLGIQKPEVATGNKMAAATIFAAKGYNSSICQTVLKRVH